MITAAMLVLQSGLVALSTRTTRRVNNPAVGVSKALLARADGLAAFPRVSVRQNGCLVAEKRLLWTPAFGALVRIPADVLDAVRHGEA